MTRSKGISALRLRRSMAAADSTRAARGYRWPD